MNLFSFYYPTQTYKIHAIFFFFFLFTPEIKVCYCNESISLFCPHEPSGAFVRHHRSRELQVILTSGLTATVTVCGRSRQPTTKTELSGCGYRQQRISMTREGTETLQKHYTSQHELKRLQLIFVYHFLSSVTHDQAKRFWVNFSSSNSLNQTVWGKLSKNPSASGCTLTILAQQLLITF